MIIFVVFSPTLKNEFVNFDDDKFIYNNELVTNANWKNVFTEKIYTPFYKPLVYLSWIIEYRNAQGSAFIFHLNNLILHILNTIVLYLILLKLGQGIRNKQNYRLMAFMLTLFWSLHPLRVESVAWAVERKDVLSSFFYLFSIFLYLKYLTKPQLFLIIISTLCFFLALLSKSMTITLPFILVLFDLFFRRSLSKKWLLEKIPFIMVMTIGLYLYGAHSGFSGHLQLTSISEDTENSQKLQSEINNRPFYDELNTKAYRVMMLAKRNFLPFKLSVLYPVPGSTADRPLIMDFSFIILLIVILIPFLFYQKIWKYHLFLVFFVLTIMPVLGMGNNPTNFISDRYTYIPSIGFFIILFFVMIGLNKNKVVYERMFIIILVLIIVEGYYSFQRTKIWKNSISLWTDVINKYENMPLAYYNRGNSWAENNNYSLAQIDYNRAVALDDNYVKAYANRGNVRNKLGNIKGAIDDYSKCISFNPQNAEFYYNRAIAYDRMKKYSQAISDYSKAVSLNPGNVSFYYNRGNVYNKINKYDLAVQDFTRALELKPGYYQAYANRGAAYFKKGMLEKALSDFSSSIDINENNPTAYFNRGMIYLMLEKSEAGCHDLRKASNYGHSGALVMMNEYCSDN